MARSKQTAPKRHSTATKMEARAGGKAAKLGAGVGKKERKPHRFRPGTVALREIKRFQKSVDTLIPKAPLKRLIREIAAPYQDELRFSGLSFEALQQASEAYLTDLFADANVCAIEHNRVTVEPRDLRLAMKMRHDQNNMPQTTPIPEHGRKHVVPSKRRVRKSKSAAATQSGDAGEVPTPVAVESEQPPSF